MDDYHHHYDMHAPFRFHVWRIGGNWQQVFCIRPLPCCHSVLSSEAPEMHMLQLRLLQLLFGNLKPR
jgi:hypothetical protein